MYLFLLPLYNWQTTTTHALHTLLSVDYGKTSSGQREDIIIFEVSSVAFTFICFICWNDSKTLCILPSWSARYFKYSSRHVTGKVEVLIKQKGKILCGLDFLLTSPSRIIKLNGTFQLRIPAIRPTNSFLIIIFGSPIVQRAKICSAAGLYISLNRMRNLDRQSICMAGIGHPRCIRSRWDG